MSNTLDYEDFENIPVELYKQLNIPDHLKLKINIVKVIKENKGEANINDILIGMYNKTKKVIKRKTMWRILSDMKKLDMIESADVKGVYRIKDKK